ncbi:MAG: hypothetical protein ACE1ZA_06370 [Pseudomonadales bacterium]
MQPEPSSVAVLPPQGPLEAGSDDPDSIRRGRSVFLRYFEPLAAQRSHESAELPLVIARFAATIRPKSAAVSVAG